MTIFLVCLCVWLYIGGVVGMFMIADDLRLKYGRGQLVFASFVLSPSLPVIFACAGVWCVRQRLKQLKGGE